MTAVALLVTTVDTAVHNARADPHSMSVSACHEAALVDGRRFRLLDHRGWSASHNRIRAAEVRDDDAFREDVPDIWSATSVADVEATARCVVGPDEPSDGRSQEDIEAAHWAFLSHVLLQHGVVVEARALKQLPHEVVLSDRLLARLGQERRVCVLSS